jgi:uncharacterized membrane protein
MFAGEGKPLVLLPALAELIVDKLPSTPSRTRPFGLLARATAAALACAALARRTDEDVAGTALLGVTGALASAYIGAAYRSAIAGAHIPDFPAALLEDVIAYATAFRCAYAEG